MADDKPTLRIQVKNPGLSAAGVSDKFIDASGAVVDRIAETINGFAGEVLSKLALEKPSKIKIEFGVNAGGKAGVPFVTEGSIDAHLKIEVEWELAGT